MAAGGWLGTIVLVVRLWLAAQLVFGSGCWFAGAAEVCPDAGGDVVCGVRAEGADYRAGGSAGRRLAGLGFTWRTDRAFRNGDILVWGNGRYGHVAVWYNGKIFDQNHAGRRTAALDPFFSSGYLGYWRR